MIEDFLLSNLRARVLHGQPLILDQMSLYYKNCARLFDFGSEVEREAARSVSTELEAILGNQMDRERILFIRPKSDIHVASAVSKFQAIEIKEGCSDVPKFYGGVLRLPFHYWHWLVSNAISSSVGHKILWQQKLLDQVAEFLLRLRPKLIVFNTDVHVLERAFALVATALEIPVVTIQNGLFSSKYDDSVHDGDASDYFIAWSEFTKRMIAKAGSVPASRIHVLGYPYPVSPSRRANEPGKTISEIVFIGQPYESFQVAQAEAKRRIIKTVRDECQKLGLRMRYRPHPGERDDTFTDLMNPSDIISRSIPLKDILADHQTFIGLTSTALVEAALFGHTAIQVYDPIFEMDHFGEVGACYACEASSESIRAMLAQALSNRLPSQNVSEDYLPVPVDLKGELLSIYLSILSNWADRPIAKRGTGNTICVFGSEQELHSVWESIREPGYELVNASTGSLLNPKEAMAGATNIDGRPIICAEFNLDSIHRLLEDVSSRSSENLIVGGEAAAITAPFIATHRKIDAAYLVLSPPDLKSEEETSRNGSYYLSKLVSSFTAAILAPTRIVVGPNISGIEAIDGDMSVAFLAYRLLMDEVGGTKIDLQPTEVDRCLAILKSALAAISRSTEGDLVSEELIGHYRAVEQEFQGTGGGSLFELAKRMKHADTLAQEFERVRQTKFWKAREFLVAATRRIRGR